MAHHKRINNTFQTPQELQYVSVNAIRIHSFLHECCISPERGTRTFSTYGTNASSQQCPSEAPIYLSSLGNAHPLEIFNGRNRRTYLHSLEPFKRLEEKMRTLTWLNILRVLVECWSNNMFFYSGKYAVDKTITNVTITFLHNHLKVTRTPKVWPLFARASNNNCTSRDLVGKNN